MTARKIRRKKRARNRPYSLVGPITIDLTYRDLLADLDPGMFDLGSGSGQRPILQNPQLDQNERPAREEARLIARTWRGWTRRQDADAYVEYLMETGIKEYRETAGNRAAYILRRDEGERTEFVTLIFWDSLEAVHEFAGPEAERAVFYPEDDRFLVDRETDARNYEIVDMNAVEVLGRS